MEICFATNLVGRRAYVRSKPDGMWSESGCEIVGVVASSSTPIVYLAARSGEIEWRYINDIKLVN